ncbi:hypothetical protein ES705_34075 [subsurface metagenome]
MTSNSCHTVLRISREVDIVHIKQGTALEVVYHDAEEVVVSCYFCNCCDFSLQLDDLAAAVSNFSNKITGNKVIVVGIACLGA